MTRLTTHGVLEVKSKIVDSMPRLAGPSSKTGGQSIPKKSTTWLAVVGLVRLDGFALGAARGKSRQLSIA